MSLFRTRGLLAIAGGLLSFCLTVLPAPVAAQQVVRGRVADAMDRPIGGAVVLLHAITEESGVELARDTADAQGRFELAYAFEEGPLYFVATRLDGELYMADPFREHPGGELVLRAGAGVEPLRLDAATPPPAAVQVGDESSHAGWWVVLIGLAIVGFVAWLVHRSRRRPTRARELLVEIARLDEAQATAGKPADDDGYRGRRDELRARLIEALELDADADRH